MLSALFARSGFNLLYSEAQADKLLELCEADTLLANKIKHLKCDIRDFKSDFATKRLFIARKGGKK